MYSLYGKYLTPKEKRTRTEDPLCYRIEFTGFPTIRPQSTTQFVVMSPPKLKLQPWLWNVGNTRVILFSEEILYTLAFKEAICPNAVTTKRSDITTFCKPDTFLNERSSLKAGHIFLATSVQRCYQSYQATNKHVIHKLEII